jgi:putative ABC transport system permease protein
VIPWMLAVAHCRKAWFRSLLTAGSVAVAVFLFCMLRTVVTSIEATVSATESSRLISQSAVSLFVNLPIAMYPKMKSQPGVRAVTHWTWFGGVFRDPKEFFPRFAVDPASFREVYGDRRPGDSGEYRLPTDHWEAWERERGSCIVGRATAEKYGFRVGDSIPLEGTIYPGSYSFVVRGIYESANPAYDEMTMFFHWDYLDESQGRMGSVSTYTLDLDRAADAPAVAAAVDAQFSSSANRSRTLTERAFQAQFVSMWGNYTLLLSFIGGAVLVAAFMVTLNTLLLNARERVTEVGVLKTLGFPDGAIGTLNLVEAVGLCLLGGVAGCAVSFVARAALEKPLQMFVPTFQVLPATYAAGLAIAAALGLVAGAVPGILAARMPVVRALRRLG